MAIRRVYPLPIIIPWVPTDKWLPAPVHNQKKSHRAMYEEKNLPPEKGVRVDVDTCVVPPVG